MPFIIAAIVYGALAALVITVFTVVALARGRQPGREMLGGAIGSAIGFVAGSAAAALFCIAVPKAGVQFGATVVVVLAGLTGALIGAALGVSKARQSWR